MASPGPPPAPLPVFLYPNGFEVALTPPGAVLRFGEPATVATADTEGRLLVWSVIAHDSVFISHENVALIDPKKAINVDHYRCFAYDITFLGAVSRVTGDPLVLNGIPDLDYTAVTAPEIIPSTFDGSIARHVEGGVDRACGIPEDNRLPTTEGLLETNYPYARGTLGAVDVATAPEHTVAGVSYHFDEGIPGVADAPVQPAPIRWE